MKHKRLYAITIQGAFGLNPLLVNKQLEIINPLLRDNEHYSQKSFWNDAHPYINSKGDNISHRGKRLTAIGQ